MNIRPNISALKEISCFQHIIGLPVRVIQSDHYTPTRKQFMTHSTSISMSGLRKSTGLGITEFMIRYMAWLCLKDKALAGSQMCVVTGPRIDLAITLIDRMNGYSNQKQEYILIQRRLLSN